MQSIVVITLKPVVSVTRYTGTGWRKAGLDADAINDVVVKLLSSDWRLVSADDSCMYFSRELDIQLASAVEEKTLKSPPIAQPTATYYEPPIVRFSEGLRPGDTVQYEREPAEYDKPVVEPIYVRPNPMSAGSRQIPQKVAIDEWLSS